MKKNNEIVIVGCKDTTYELMNAIINFNYKIDLLITIDEKIAKKNKVAGYYKLNSFAEDNNIPVYNCHFYSLKSDKDVIKLSSINIKLLLVIGWQRLIPKWLLDHLEIGAFGMHGSSQPLPFGRGRSPLNWSLIQNKNIFVTNLFKYNDNVDAGQIADYQFFDINIFDNSQTLHYKNTLSMIKIIKKNLPNMLCNNIDLLDQLDKNPTYYPKRTADDGIIFWDKDTQEIYNLIRAVTLPFPGAFSYIETEKVIIWKAFPFDTRLFNPYEFKPGEIIWKFLNGDFIVKTGTSSLIVVDYELSDNLEIQIGDLLHSANFMYKNPFEYPQ